MHPKSDHPQPDPSGRFHTVGTHHERIVPIELGGELLGQKRTRVIKDPGSKFCLDRFRALPIKAQVDLLSDIALVRLESCVDGRSPSFEVRTILARLGRAYPESFSKDEVASYYLSYPPRALELWMEEGIREPAIRHMVLERLFDQLRHELPAISYTLAHIYSGGFYGLLTARAHREHHLSSHVHHLSEQFGFAPVSELVYFVNDGLLSRRLGGGEVSTAERKATVLKNFATGTKIDELGRVAPMAIGKRFSEVTFIDDEPKNLRVAVRCLGALVIESVLQSLNSSQPTALTLNDLNARCSNLVESSFDAEGVSVATSIDFWARIVEEVLGAPSVNGKSGVSALHVIDGLRSAGAWLPDAIRILDGRSLPIEPSIDRLRALFYSREPLVVGSRPSVLLNDIDRTLLSVQARFYVRDSIGGDREPLLSITQEEFAKNPDASFWIAEASRVFDVPASRLQFDWRHFHDPETIRRDVIAALFNGEIARNPHGGRLV